MHSTIYGICILDNIKDTLKEFTPLDEESFSYEDLNSFSDYVTQMDLEEEGRPDFEEHLQCCYPHFTTATYNNATIYKIPVEDIYQILKEEWESYKKHSIQLQLEEFISPFNLKTHQILIDLEGDKQDVRYAELMINQQGESMGYQYPETLLETLRYIYTNAVRENKKEILIQLVGVLDYHS